MTIACTHQLTRPAIDASSSRQVSRNVIISVAMKQRDHDRLERDLGPEPDRPHERAADEQVDDAGEDADRKRRQDDAVGVEPAGLPSDRRCPGRAGTRRRVAAEGDEPPEHERVRQAGDGPLANRLPLQHDVDEEPRRTRCRAGRARTCLARRRSAGRACATCAAKAPRKSEQQDPERDDLHVHNDQRGTRRTRRKNGSADSAGSAFTVVTSSAPR